MKLFGVFNSTSASTALHDWMSKPSSIALVPINISNLSSLKLDLISFNRFKVNDGVRVVPPSDFFLFIPIISSHFLSL